MDTSTKSPDTDLSNSKTERAKNATTRPADNREMNDGKRIPPFEKFYRGISFPIRLLPDFLIIGTQRGGTTSLHRYLDTHPCVGPAANKDLHFFDRRYHKGLAWYRGHFPTSIEKYYAEHIRRHPFVTGEASPSYLFHPYAPKRVAAAMPHVKLIILLRNPVDRAYSQYHHAVELGHETIPTFEDALDAEEERIAREEEHILKDEHYYSEQYKHLSYLTKGIYVDQLRRWMDLFPREQFLILRSEDFYADSATTYQEVLTFLGLPQAELQGRKKGFKQYNNNAYSSKMDPATRKRLIEYFEPYNAQLYELLGVDLGWDR